MRKIITTKNAPEPVGPYSQAQVVNGFLYTAGQIGIDPHINKLITDNIQTETKRTINNIDAILNEADYQLHHVVKATIYITDIGSFKLINEVYAAYFSQNFPAREVVEVNKLPLNANIMISVVAFKE